MNQELLHRIKIKLEKEQLKEEKKEKSRQKRNNISTEKMYYLVWKYILKNSKNDYNKIIINGSQIKKSGCYILKIKVNNTAKKVFLSFCNPFLLRSMLEEDGLRVSTEKNYNSYWHCTLNIYAEKFMLQNLVQKENNLDNKPKAHILVPNISKNGNN